MWVIVCIPREDMSLDLPGRVVDSLNYPIGKWLAFVHILLIHELAVEGGVSGVVAKCGRTLRGGCLHSRMRVVADIRCCVALHVASLVTAERRSSLMDRAP